MRLPVASLAFALLLAAASPAAAQMAPPPGPPPPRAPVAYAPNWWAPPPAPLVTERRSTGMMVTGIVLWAVGGVVAGVGAGITVFEGLSQCVYEAAPRPAGPLHHAARRERTGTAQQALDSCGRDLPMGSGILAAGLLTSVAGIPLFVVGNSRVRVRPRPDALTMPEVKVGLTGAQMSWTF